MMNIGHVTCFLCGPVFDDHPPYQVSRGPPDLGNFRRPWQSRSPGGAPLLSWHSQFGALWYTVIYCDGQCWNMLDDLNLWGNYAPQIWTTAGIPWAASAEPYLDLWRLVWFLSGRPRSRDGPMYCIYGSSFLPFVSCPCVPAVVVSNCWPTKLLRLLYMTHE